MTGYAIARLDEIDELDDGRCPMRPVRHHFGITSFGINAFTGREAGDRILNEHDEADDADRNEELYLVTSGRAVFELDGEALVAELVGGHIDMMVTDVVTGLPQYRAGKARALGVSSPTRLSVAPELPTIAEAGVKGYELTFWFAAYLPAKTPPAVVERLRGLFVNATKGAPARTFFKSTGIEPYTMTSAELARFQASESAKWAKVIKAAGITPQ